MGLAVFEHASSGECIRQDISLSKFQGLEDEYADVSILSVHKGSSFLTDSSGRNSSFKGGQRLALAIEIG